MERCGCSYKKELEGPSNPKIMKILILTLADDSMREMADISALNKMRYAQKHDYYFAYEKKICKDLGVGRGNCSWNKIVYVKRYLPFYDWVFWTDADSLILNQTRKIEEFLPTTNGKDFIIGKDRQPWINAGQFFIRNCEWSNNFLALVELHTWVERVGPQYGWWEQGAIRYLIEQPYHAEHVQYVPCKTFNGYADFIREDKDLAWMRPDLFSPGDFLCHYSGLV